MKEDLFWNILSHSPQKNFNVAKGIKRGILRELSNLAKLSKDCPGYSHSEDDKQIQPTDQTGNLQEL